MVTREMLDECKAFLSRGSALEDVLCFLRKAGASKIDSIIALRELTAFSPRQAKIIVHFSRAWQDLARPHEDFHTRLLEALRAGGCDVRETAPGPEAFAEIRDALRAIGIEAPDVLGERPEQAE